MQLSTYHRVVRASALYDILFTAALAHPWTQALAHGAMSGLNQALCAVAAPGTGGGLGRAAVVAG